MFNFKEGDYHTHTYKTDTENQILSNRRKIYTRFFYFLNATKEQKYAQIARIKQSPLKVSNHLNISRHRKLLLPNNASKSYILLNRWKTFDRHVQSTSLY